MPNAARRLLCASLAFGPLAVAASARQVEIEGRLHLAAYPGQWWSDTFSRFFDVDGDGDKDFAWGGDDTDQSYLGIRVDRGHGAYERVVAYSWIEYTIPNSIAAGDFDGDGVREIVFGSALQRAYVLSRTATGAYAESFDFPIVSPYSGLETGDLDGDGDVDVIGVSQAGFRVHWNVGGAFPAPATLFATTSPAYALSLGDLDGDGDLDALTTTNAPPAVVVLENLGGGAFAVPVAHPTGTTPNALALADFDGDGLLDVAVASSPASSVVVLLNLGSGAFAAPVASPTGFHPVTIDTGDIDGDGDPDVVVTSRDSAGGAAVLFHQGGGAFAAPVTYANGPQRNAAVTDVDDDGDLDLVLADRDALLNRGDGTFALPPFDVAPPNGSNTNVLAGDLDGDGDEDVVLYTYYGLQVRTNDGAGNLQAAVQIASGLQWQVAQLGDVDGDGDLDVLTTGSGNTGVRVLPNQVSSFGPEITIPGGTGAAQLDLGDVDGDGRADVVTRLGSAFAFARNTGGATWAPFATIAGATAGPGGWTLADVDGDGDPDLVTSFLNQLRLLRNQGGLVFAPAVPLAATTNLAAVVASDVDADGDVDLVTTDVLRTYVLWNLGGGAYSAPTVLGPPTTVYRPEDLDGDGDLDVLGSRGGTHGDAYEYLGGTSFAPLRRFGIAGAPSIATVDLDRDGDQDVIASSVGRLCVLENGGRTGATFCAGDGSGTPCPCGNASAPGSGLGCVNGLGRAGALSAAGSSSLLTDSLRLRGAGMTNGIGLYFQGTSAVQSGAGAVFGDGLRCVAGTIVRLGLRSNVAGASTFPGAGQPPLRVLGQVSAPGTRLYQVWYRDAASFCTSATWNLTNALRLTWGA